MSVKTTLTPQDKTLVVDVLIEALDRAKQSPAIEEHNIAVKRYRRELARLLKKLDPRGWHTE